MTVRGDGIQVVKTIVDTETQITATVNVAAGATVGLRQTTVSTPLGASNALHFTVEPVRPQRKER